MVFNTDRKRIKSLDPVDMSLFVVTILGAAVMTNIAIVEIFNFDFADVVFAAGGIEFTFAWIMSTVALGVTILTNDNTSVDQLGDDVQNLDDVYMYTVVATFGLTILWLLVPQIPSFFQSSDVLGLIFIMIMAAGQMIVGYLL